jgi:rhodanese-related sulfurtransferase
MRPPTDTDTDAPLASPPSAASPAVRSADPPARPTLAGALIVLLLGMALGIGHNALGLASRPPHGIAWVAEGDTALATLEDLGHGHPHGEATTHDTLASASPAPAASTTPRPATPPAATSDPPSGSAGAAAPGTPPPATSPASPARGDVPTIPDVPGPLALELPTFKKLYDAGAALVVDAREAEEYAAGHIAGAVHLSYNDALAEPEKAKRLSHGGRPIVVYCSSATCHLARDLAGFLVESGQRRVLVYEGGWKDWSAAGYPTARGEAPGARP